MGIWSSTKKVASKVVDVRFDKWMSMGFIDEHFQRTKVILTDLVRPQKATRSETFEQARQRLGLSEEDLQQRKIEFTRLCYTFLVLGALIIAYALYMLYMGSPFVTLICFCLALYAFSQAFRFHFWLFQLKNRKLGCSVREWLNSEVDETTRSNKKVNE